jgi:hypothetical protein
MKRERWSDDKVDHERPHLPLCELEEALKSANDTPKSLLKEVMLKSRLEGGAEERMHLRSE